MMLDGLFLLIAVVICSLGHGAVARESAGQPPLKGGLNIESIPVFYDFFV